MSAIQMVPPSGLRRSDLLGLVRLYRAGADGARDQLQAVIDTQAEELPGLLGFPASRLPRLLEPDAVELLATTVEAAVRRDRRSNATHRRDRAQRLAARLGETAEPRNGGCVLNAVLLREMLETWSGTGQVVFAPHGAVDLGRLRALLREVRTPMAVSVAADAIEITYSTAHSRGSVRLHLHPAPSDDRLVVPLRHVELRPVRNMAAMPVPTGPIVAVRPRPVHRPFVEHLAAAVAAALAR